MLLEHVSLEKRGKVIFSVIRVVGAIIWVPVIKFDPRNSFTSKSQNSAFHRKPPYLRFLGH